MSLDKSDLFDGLPQAAINDIFARSRHQRFGAEQVICQEGDPGDSVLIIEHGAAEVLIGAGQQRVRRLRRGDVIGEISLITGEPRSATVRATVATDVVTIHRDSLAAVLAQYPAVLTNLSRILSKRLARAHVEQLPSGRGEAVGLILGASAVRHGDAILDAAAAATPQSTTSIGLLAEVATALPAGSTEIAANALDQMLAGHGFVFLVAGAETANLDTLVAQLDRTVALGSTADVARIRDRLGSTSEVESVVVGDGSPHPLPAGTGWIGRHLTRTKLGLALGAGGAKGYAHVGALAVLEQAGYTIDCVAGSSIGAIVGACLAQGMGSDEIEATLQKRFSPDVVKAVFSLSFSGTSTGYETMREMTRELAGDKTFADLQLPLEIMTVDLVSRLPVPLATGPLAEALLAATALAGLFPPFELDGRRLVDGLALVPVPVQSARTLGADIVVSVNLMSRDTLPAWPGEEPAPPPEGRQRMLETLLEVMDLAQLDASVRHAAAADVVVTPRFGPCTWRDFHLADRFVAAGREAATSALGRLKTLATPTNGGNTNG